MRWIDRENEGGREIEKDIGKIREREIYENRLPRLRERKRKKSL